MKTRTAKAPALPKSVPAHEVEENLPKDATLNLRLSKAAKASMAATAKALNLTLTEYVWQCHLLVDRHIKR